MRFAEMLPNSFLPSETAIRIKHGEMVATTIGEYLREVAEPAPAKVIELPIPDQRSAAEETPIQQTA